MSEKQLDQEVKRIVDELSTTKTSFGTHVFCLASTVGEIIHYIKTLTPAVNIKEVDMQRLIYDEICDRLWPQYRSKER